MAARATIVIASLNEGQCLWKTVQSCVDTTVGLDCEILVADDDSRDKSVSAVRRRFPAVRVVSHGSRRGVASTKDLGARSAAGDVLVFLDAHCKPEPGAVERLVADVEALNGRAVFTPAVAALDTETWENQRGQVGYSYAVDLERFDSRWIDRSGARPWDRFHQSPALIGCCFAVSRALYEELRGFDAGMLQWGSEDIDFGLRAWLMGSLILNDPQALIGHRFQSSFANFEVTNLHTLANQIRVARKNFDDHAWEDWLSRCRGRHDPSWWTQVWTLFAHGRPSAEAERAYLLEHRVRDEYWYAEYFGLAWPRRPPI